MVLFIRLFWSDVPSFGRYQLQRLIMTILELDATRFALNKTPEICSWNHSKKSTNLVVRSLM